MQFGDWLGIWLANYKQGTMKQTSYHQLELLIAKIPPELKARPLSEVSPMELQGFINVFSSDASKSYADKMRVLIRSAFDEAYENGLCATSPARRLKGVRIMEPPRQSYTKDEVAKIVIFADSYRRPLIGAAIVTLLFTGLRRGELLGLTWADMGENYLAVNRAVFLDKNMPVVIDYLAKTPGSIRKVPMLPGIRRRIKALPHHGPYIFGTGSGTLMHPRNFSRDYLRFFTLLREHAPEVRYLSPHSCRHTYATLALSGGVDLRVVQALLGHTNIQTTSRYTHPDQGTLYNAIQGLSVLLG